MSIQGTSGANFYWYTLAPSLIARPTWMCCWTAGSSTTAGALITVSAAPGASNHFMGPLISSAKYDAITLGSATGQAIEGTGSVLSTGAWQHVMHMEYSSASRELFVNGVSRATNSTSVPTLTVDRLLIGMSNTSNPLPLTRWVAEAVFGFGTLSTWQIQALGGGANPLTLGLNILAYYPLRNTLRDFGPNRMHLVPTAATDPTWRDHPPVAPILNRRLFKRTVITVNRRPFITIAA